MKKSRTTSSSSELPVSLRSRMTVVCPPEKQGMSRLQRLTGMTCRALILFCAVFGLSLFVCDAFKLITPHKGPISPATLALFSGGAVLLFTLFSLWRWGWLAGLLLFAGGGMAALRLLPASFFPTALTVALNACLKRLTDIGYFALAPYAHEVEYGRFSESVYLHAALALFVLLLAAVFVPCLINRVRLALPAAVGGCIIIAVFVYNLSVTNWGFMLILSSFAAILVLAAYDRRYLAPAHSDERAAAAQFFAPDPAQPRVLPPPAHLAEQARKKATASIQSRSADEEISAYLGATVKPPRPTPAERTEQRRLARRYYASLRAARRYRRLRRQSRIAYGGYAGLGMLVLALLMLAVPAACTKESFAEIGFIERPMNHARRYVTALLMGDNPILDELGYAGNASNFAPHSTDASIRAFTGERIFEVETMYNTNLYLRGWIATDYRDGLWYTADKETLDEYRSIFGTAFSPEIMRANFYTYVDPDVVTYTDYVSRYQNHAEKGFVTMQVNLRRVGGESNFVYLPSYYNPRVGLVNYASGEGSKMTYINYFDGIYTGRKFIPGAEYGAVAFVTTMRHPDFIDNLSYDIAAYNLARAAMKEWLALPAEDRTEFYEASFSMLDEKIRVALSRDEKGADAEIRSSRGQMPPVYKKAGELLTRYLNMTEYELSELLYAWQIEDYYRENVYTNYTAPADSAIIRELADELLGDYISSAEKSCIAPRTYTERHNAVIAVMRYLGEQLQTGETDEEGNPVTQPRFTYTLNPTLTPDPALDGVENFLTVTKEGYCVQFASAAALLLREAGIPARYVEGYIATNFRRDRYSASTQRYRTTVNDYHAHAWIEVYYDGIGWLNYEATPPYMSEMYDEEGSSAEHSPVLPWDTAGEGEEDYPPGEEGPDSLPEEFEISEDTQNLLLLCTAAGLLLLAAALILTGLIILRRTRRADKARRQLLNLAAANPSSDQHRAIARTLIDETAALLAAVGSAPEPGEQRGEYAARLEPDYGALCPEPLPILFDAIAAEEFGPGMDSEALASLALFRIALGKAARERMHFPRRLYYRYIKHLL